MSIEAVGRLGAALTVCARCGVERAEHSDPAISHRYQGLTQRQVEAMVREEAARL